MLARVCVGILTAMTIRACLDWVAYAAPTERRCLPLVISGKPCGKLCRTPTGWAIRGCKPLNQLLRA